MSTEVKMFAYSSYEHKPSDLIEIEKLFVVTHRFGSNGNLAYFELLAYKLLLTKSNKIAVLVVDWERNSEVPIFEDFDILPSIEDVEFVDVIHTSTSANELVSKLLLMGNFGISKPLGRIDLYPNGGIIHNQFVGASSKISASCRAVTIQPKRIFSFYNMQFHNYLL
ncbi:Ves G 1 allergen precursor-like protein [Dinothrombium tinctorium]|uniref:Ves G 1 allergen-like protein n=1 Tax=Dinothrombium tinctorium TaxID=1965070 RepID=A0A3S4QU19_9ACAR|nr:Ves G 1 allergen precursor-like protein [Dinothrombium tinctorium]